METLDKQFYDKMYEKYPLAIENFRQYVDKYKKDVEWDVLFPDGLCSPIKNKDGSVSYLAHRQPKFHHLPFLLQIGLIIDWIYFLYDFSSFVTFPDPNDLLIDGIEIDKVKRNFEFMLRFINEIRLPKY